MTDSRWRQRRQNYLRALARVEQAQDLNSPWGVLKKAFEVGLVAEGQSWLQGLEDRNLTAHTYDEATAHKVEELIRSRHLPLFEALKQRFEGLGER